MDNAVADLPWSRPDDDELLPTTEPERYIKQKGFAWLKKSHAHLYADIKRIIDLAVDKYDWGYLHPSAKHSDKKPKPRGNKKDEMNIWFRSRKGKRPRTLSLIMLDEHGRRERTIYTTSHPTSGHALLMFDIDDKKGIHHDAEALLTHLQSRWFPTMYRQTSTFGKGAHGYIAVKWCGTSIDAFRELLARLEDAVALHCSKRFGASFELKGKPPHTSANGEYVTCGTLAKFPWIASAADAEALIAGVATMYRVRDLQAVIDELTTESGGSADCCAISRADATHPPVLPRVESNDPIEKQQPKQVMDDHDSLSVSLSPLIDMKHCFISIYGEEGEKDLYHPDPARRMGNAGRLLACRLGRPPTVLELLSAYQQWNLGTGEDDDGNRAALAAKTIEWVSATYKPTGTCDLETYLPLVRATVTDSHRSEVRKTNRSTYTDQELAVVLYALTKGATTYHKAARYQFTSPNNSLLKLLSDIAPASGLNENQQRMKCSAMKSVLALAGLIEQMDGGWTIGRAKRYGLGTQHPRYSDYLAIRESLERTMSPPTSAAVG